MYPSYTQAESLFPYSSFPQESNDSDFLHYPLENPSNVERSEGENGPDIDPDLDEVIYTSHSPLTTSAAQAWDSPVVHIVQQQDLEPASGPTPSAMSVQQIIAVSRQQAAAYDAARQIGNFPQATVSPAQLFQPRPSATQPIASTSVSNTTSIPATKSSTKAESLSLKSSGVTKSKIAQSVAGKLEPTSRKAPSPVQRQTSGQVAFSKASTNVNDRKLSPFETIKGDFLNGDAKYGWHGKFGGPGQSPLDALMAEIAPRPVQGEATIDGETPKLLMPKVDLSANEIVELAQTLLKGIPSAYSKAWKQHAGGLRFFQHYLDRGVKGLETEPTGPWSTAVTKLLDLLQKVLPPVQEIGQYGLGPPLSALRSGKHIDKELRRHVKDVRQALIAQETGIPDASVAQKRTNAEVTENSTNKKPKTEPALSTKVAAPVKNLVRVAAKKNGGVDMSAFGMATPALKAKRVAVPSKVDAVSSLLSGLSPAVLNSQANSKVPQGSASFGISVNSGKKKKNLQVRFKEGEDLCKVKMIENRDSLDYESVGANTTQLEGEGRFMKEHGALEEQQEWYPPQSFDGMPTPVSNDSPEPSDVEQSTPLENTSGTTAILDHNISGFMEWLPYQDRVFEEARNTYHEEPVVSQTVQNQVTPFGNDLASLLSHLSKPAGSNSPIVQDRSSIGGSSQTPLPPAASSPLVIDLGALSDIVSTVNRNASKIAPPQNTYTPSFHHNVPIHTQHPQVAISQPPSYPTYQANTAQDNGWQGAPYQDYQQFNQQHAQQYGHQKPRSFSKGADRGLCYEELNKGECHKPHCRFPHANR